MAEPDDQRRRRTHLAGLKAERVAAVWLLLKGYRILARRFRVSGGEIDIVARRGTTIAIVEVKARPSLDLARSSISATKRRRIERAAAVWLSRHPWASSLTLRGDVVVIAPWHWPRHVSDALQLRL